MPTFRDQLGPFVQHAGVPASCNDDFLCQAQIATARTATVAARFLSDLPLDGEWSSFPLEFPHKLR